MLKTASNERIETDQAISDAARQAYDSLAADGWSPDEVHKVAACYVLTDKIVTSLVSRGFNAEHQVRIGDVGEHSYVALQTKAGAEIIADASWQQFLPHHKVNQDVPKLLIGSRGQVIQQAQYFGVPAPVTEIWQAGGLRMNTTELRRQNDEAAAAADALDMDKWAAFAAGAVK